ncbi:hypothetical protein ABK905_02180 [Acerihabitans sp. KWT182]|uniref:Uncharacterized protein n=1 Tax=Acerihabitans sp. KWT182 TaxID=3157919 RepID=A0AAU7QAQ9_9GAMM
MQSWESVSFDDAPLADINLSGAVLINDAPADSVSRNAMRYRVYQTSSGTGVSGAALTLSVSGGATLIPPPALG